MLGTSHAQRQMQICIDQFDLEGFKARIYHGRLPKGVEAYTLNEFFSKLEYIFDKIEYPCATTKRRTFNKEANNHSDIEIPTSMEFEKRTYLWDEEGELVTFMVRVQSRMNTSWQGVIRKWNSSEEKKFKSELEFVKIMYDELEQATKMSGWNLDTILADADE